LHFEIIVKFAIFVGKVSFMSQNILWVIAVSWNSCEDVMYVVVRLLVINLQYMVHM